MENVTDLKCQPCTSRMLFCPECTRPLYHYIQHGKRNAHIGFLPIRHFKIKRNLYVAAIIKGKKLLQYELLFLIFVRKKNRYYTSVARQKFPKVCNSSLCHFPKSFFSNPTYITKAIIFPRILVIPHPKPFKEKRWFKFFVRHKHATYPKTKYYLKDKCGGFFVSNKVFRQRTTCSDIIGTLNMKKFRKNFNRFVAWSKVLVSKKLFYSLIVNMSLHIKMKDCAVIAYRFFSNIIIILFR